MHGRAHLWEQSALIIARVPSPAPPVSCVLAQAGADDRPFVLASGAGDPALSRWSYAALEACGQVPDLGAAARAIRGWASAAGSDVPFCGGAVGYAGYDQGWAFQPRPRVPRADPLGMPAAAFQLYDAIYARSEATREGYVIAQPTAEAERRAARLQAAVARGSLARVEGGLDSALSPAISRATHLARIEDALALIREGEIYQVNLTYALEARYRGSPIAAFERLLRDPPPFAALLRTGAEAWILSASPECFFDLDARTRALAVYPIKGTRRRSPDPARDVALARALAADEKERAEHLMIVDLLRNDLGRIADIGSVAVRGLCYVESFPRVHHLTSRVTAQVPRGLELDAVQEALFPGGSITGVPKLRAMEAIDALEDAPRGVYTGAIGYVSPDGSARTSIAIRTAQIARGELRFGVGGGIVADSIPEREWEETELKAQALAIALER